MNITICGSIAFFDEMLQTKAELEAVGHVVEIPPTEVKNEHGEMIPVKEYYSLRKSTSDDESWIWSRKKEAMKSHFDKVAWSDAILVLNHEKKRIPGYVGANTFLEMGLALHLDKKIFLLNPLPDMENKEELLGMQATVLDGDLSNIV